LTQPPALWSCVFIAILQVGCGVNERDQRLNENLKNLAEGNREARRRAVITLGDLKDTRAVDPLLEALDDYDLQVCVLATAALGKIEDARVVDILKQQLSHKHALVRSSAASVLGRLEAESAILDLQRVVKEDEDAVVRVCAAESLVYTAHTK